ncbi:MAG: hypothetical protein ACI845_002430 [Gammaproteobacteria bacterium]
MGNAHHRDLGRPGEDTDIAADKAYAPLEQLYRAVPEGWDTRRLAADLYLLGSIATFLITGVGMTQLIKLHLGNEHWWSNFYDDYEQVKPYLREAIDAALEEIKEAAEPEIAEEITTLIGFLCNPDPYARGHPRNLDSAGARCGLERFISRFKVLATRAEYNLKSRGSRERH